jgi:hypothetical protein
LPFPETCAVSQPTPQGNVSGAAPSAAHNDGGVFLRLLGLYALVLYPILRANRYYNDDLKRALIGRAGWDSNGRPLTTLLMRALQCYDHAMVDISPLTQIGAIAILAWVGVLIARRFAIGSPWMAALVAFPMGGQPFFLENLSYKFDALSMSLALLLALLPMLALREHRRAWWLGVLALFASLSFYQPAINAYLVFMLLELAWAQLHGVRLTQLARQFFWRVLQAGVAMLIYDLLIGMHVSGWVKRETATIHGLRELPLVKANFVDFYAFIGTSFNAHWWMYFAPVLTALALVAVLVGLRYALALRATQRTWLVAMLCAIAVLMPLAAAVGALGPMLFLRKPEIEPRVLMGIGALLAAALILAQAALRQWRRADGWAQAAAAMLALGMCVIASAYGNTLGAQKDFENHIGADLADDLATLQVTHTLHFYLLDGAAGNAPVTAHVITQLPLIHTLVPPYIAADDPFQTPGFLAYYISGVSDLRRQTDPAALARQLATLAQACGEPAVMTRASYQLYLVKDTAVVRFQAAGPHACAAPNAAATP